MQMLLFIANTQALDLCLCQTVNVFVRERKLMKLKEGRDEVRYSVRWRKNPQVRKKLNISIKSQNDLEKEPIAMVCYVFSFLF